MQSAEVNEWELETCKNVKLMRITRKVLDASGQYQNDRCYTKEFKRPLNVHTEYTVPNHNFFFIAEKKC